MTNDIITQPNGRSGFSLAPQSLDEAMRFADILSKSSIVPKDYQGSPGNVLVAVQWGAEIGLAPMQAMQNIAVINGRPSIWGDALLALVRGSGSLTSITEDVTDSAATCTVQRAGEAPVSRTFSMEDAKRAGLSGKQGPWTQYPKRMLQMRARAWALRDVFPDVLRGVHVAEEAQDMPTVKDMGTIDGSQQPTPKSTPATRAEAIKATMRKRAPDVAATTLDDVLAAISKADTMQALDSVAVLASALESPDDKQQARAAYTARKQQLQPAPVTYALVADKLNKAKDLDVLAIEADLIREVADAGQQEELRAIYENRREALGVSA